MALSVEHHLADLPVQLIQGVLQALVQFVSDEGRLRGPPLQAFGYEVVREPFEPLVGFLHLVVLGVEKDGLLDLLNVPLV